MDQRRLGQGQLGHFLRQREDDVVILGRQQVSRLSFEPLGASSGMALGAVAIAAGVVGGPFVTAVVTALQVPTERCRAAVLDSKQHADLQPRQPGVEPELRRPRDRERDQTATWSLTTLQRALRSAEDGLPEVSTYTIWCVLHEADLSWQRDRSWCHTGLATRRRKAGEVEVHDPDATVKRG